MNALNKTKREEYPDLQTLQVRGVALRSSCGAPVELNLCVCVFGWLFKWGSTSTLRMTLVVVWWWWWWPVEPDARNRARECIRAESQGRSGEAARQRRPQGASEGCRIGEELLQG